MRPETRSNSDDALLDRYLAGEASVEDTAMVQALFRRDPELAVRVQALQAGVHGLEPDAPEASRSWNSLATAMSTYRRRSAPRRDGRRSGTHVRGRWWYAALGTAAAAVCAVVLWGVGRMTAGRHATKSVATYVTGNAQRANITLNDGTIVALDVASRLDVPSDFPDGDHTVRLMGEALFSVTHHGGKPFTVMAGGNAARVLGTSFMVRHYPADTATVVAVRDGKVGVRTTIVTAMQAARVDRDGLVQVRRADPSVFGFARGVLTLNGVPFPQAIAELDRWYDADIRLGDPALASRRVAGEYAAGSLADLVSYLEMTFDVRVVRNGRVLTLLPR